MAQLKYYPKAQIRQGADRDRTLRVDHLSPQIRIASIIVTAHAPPKITTNNRSLRQRKTTTEGSEHCERDQLPQAWVHPRQFHLAPRNAELHWNTACPCRIETHFVWLDLQCG
jgi:hypothetical protein